MTDRCCNAGLVTFPMVLILAVLATALPTACQGAKTPDDRMRSLFEESGPIPDAILDPPWLTDPDRHVDMSVLLWEWVRCLFRHRRGTGIRDDIACQSNLRVIMGAVEMYNMDAGGSPLRDLKHADPVSPSSRLVLGNYLSNPVSQPSPRCDYRSYGDLSRHGIVYCAYHGAEPTIRRDLFAAAGRPAPTQVSQAQRAETRLGIIQAGLAVLLVTVVVVYRRKAARS